MGAATFAFRDTRLPELLFRYRARNWPETLTVDERERWDDYRRRRLCEHAGLSEYTFESFASEIAALRIQYIDDGVKQTLLDQLQAWAGELRAQLQNPVGAM